MLCARPCEPALPKNPSVLGALALPARPPSRHLSYHHWLSAAGLRRVLRLLAIASV